MSKLLNANFYRLKKSKIFFILSLFSVGYALINVWNEYNTFTRFHRNVDIGQIMLDYALVLGIALSIFISLYLGTEYSDGMKKITYVHIKFAIYLSNFITVLLVGFFSYALYILAVLITGLPLFGASKAELSDLLKMISCAFFAIVSYSSLFTFLSMINRNKTIVTLISILLAFGMIFYSLTALNFLSMPEEMEIVDIETGELTTRLNPYYLTGFERNFAQFTVDFIPRGQIYQLANTAKSNILLFSLYSAEFSCIMTASGILIFRKKI